MAGFSTDVAGTIYPIWPDLIGLGINFGYVTYVTP